LNSWRRSGKTGSGRAVSFLLKLNDVKEILNADKYCIIVSCNTKAISSALTRMPPAVTINKKLC